MPLTAQHATVGVLDATTDPLGGDLAWSAVHRARPRAPLSCRECGHGLHAKLSPNELRFFAHDPAAPDCSLVGESIAHRLLKLELASAIRAAGWFAELEVAGQGWRADVLATSPDGDRRMAWEAQLARVTLDELRERTARMEASGVPVCWVTDHDRPWVGAVPSIRLAVPTEPGEAGPVVSGVVAGLGTFQERWCPERRTCRWRLSGPCPGHGSWSHNQHLDLGVFVAAVLSGTVRPHRVPRGSFGWNPGTRFVWTTRPHVDAERAQLAAAERRREHDEFETSEHERHRAAIAAKLARQQALTPPAVELVGREARGFVGVRDAGPCWAMGVPLFVHDMPQGVISPVVSRISAEVLERFRGLTLFVATEAERRALVRTCGPAQRIVLFEVEIPDQPRPPAVTYPKRAGRVR